MTTPRATTASKCGASRAAATGSSKLPGTRTSVASAPASAAARWAPSTRPSMICVCQEAAMMATRSSAASTVSSGAPEWAMFCPSYRSLVSRLAGLWCAGFVHARSATAALAEARGGRARESWPRPRLAVLTEVRGGRAPGSAGDGSGGVGAGGGGARDRRQRQRVVHALALRGQVVRVLGPSRDLERHDRFDRDAQLLQGRGLDRVVRQQPDAVESECAEDRRRGAVVAGVIGESELPIRIHGVPPLILERIGPQLVAQPDTASLVTGQVDHRPTLLGDEIERLVQLF